MGRFDNIKTAIDTNINTNGNQAITGAVMNSVMKQTVDSVDTQLTELESKAEYFEEISGQVENFSITDYTEGVQIVGNGTLIDTAYFIVSAPIFLKKGQIIKTSIYAYSTATICLTENKTDVRQRTHKPITTIGNEAGRYDYTYTAIEDCYVELCAYIQYSPIPTYTIKNEGKFDKLEERVDNLERRDVMTTSTKIFIPQNGTLLLCGASFASTGNGWFENGCEELGVTPINKAEDGTSIMTMANKLAEGTLWSQAEFEELDALVIMHVHNYNVYDGGILEDNFNNYVLPFDTTITTNENYSRAYDYVIKKYRELCYNAKDNPSSKWYGSSHGKPCQIVLCTHWHDARVTFNSSIRKLAKKWGLPLVTFDENIGFTKVSPYSDGTQISVWYAHANMPESYMWTEVIDGVEYGWHQDRGREQYIQKRMGAIFANMVK